MAQVSSGELGSSAEPGVPSTLDLGRHFRELRRVVLPALLVAIVIAGIVYGVRAAAPARWSATVSASAQTSTTATQSSTDSTSAALLTAPYVALGTDTGVLHDIVTAAKVPWSDADARSRITVTDGQTPGLLTVQVLGDSAEQASAVAKQAVVTLDTDGRARAREAIAAQSAQMQADASALNDQLQSLSVLDPKRAALQTQYQAALDQINQVRGSVSARLAALSDPLTSGSPVSPQPLRDAALALLVVLIVAAELLVALRGRWGRAMTPTWARRIARKHGAEFVDCTDGVTGPGTVRVETVVLARLRSGADVLLLHDGATTDAAATAALVHAAQVESDGNGQLVELSTDDSWWRSSALEHAVSAVVVADRGAHERRATEAQLAALALADVPPLLMLIETGSAPDGGDTAGREVQDDSTEPNIAEPNTAEPESLDPHAPSTERDPSSTGSSGSQIMQ